MNKKEKSQFRYCIHEIKKYLHWKKIYHLSSMKQIGIIQIYAKKKFNETIEGTDNEIKLWAINKINPIIIKPKLDIQIPVNISIKIKPNIQSVVKQEIKPRFKLVLIEVPKEDLKKIEYTEFLKTTYWAETKLKVLKRDHYKCQHCGAKRLFQVHHLTYVNHGNEMEHMEDLITLCRVCHIKVHHLDK